jgi:hypothetical protein
VASTTGRGGRLVYAVDRPGNGDAHHFVVQ